MDMAAEEGVVALLQRPLLAAAVQVLLVPVVMLPALQRVQQGPMGVWPVVLLLMAKLKLRLVVPVGEEAPLMATQRMVVHPYLVAAEELPVAEKAQAQPI